MEGERLKYEITRRGFTLKSVADALGMSDQALGSRLRAKAVTSDTLEMVADVMGIGVGELYESERGHSEEESIREARQREKQLLRTISIAAMEGFIESKSDISSIHSDKDIYELIAEWSVKHAYALLAEFKKKGIDK